MSQNEIHLPFWEHVEEFRQTVWKILAIIGIGFCICLFFHQSILQAFLKPLNQSQSDWASTPLFHKQLTNTSDSEQTLWLSPQTQAVFPLLPGVIQKNSQQYIVPPHTSIQVVEAAPVILLTPWEGLGAVFRLSFWFGLVLTSPIWILLIFQFIAPALSTNISRIFMLWFIPFIFLFSFGALLAYFVTIPIANQYLKEFSAGIGVNFWNLNSYLEYTLLMLLGNGLGFELSGLLFLLIHQQVVTHSHLKSFRRYVYVFIFILSAVLTPPDVFSQLLLAFPLIGLYELGILFARWQRNSAFSVFSMR